MNNSDEDAGDVEDQVSRDLDTFLLDQKRYEEERKSKKARIIME